MYESYFQFNCAPFQLAPNPRFFFNSATHTRGLVVLRHALLQNDSLTVVTGDSGTGKSDLLRYFASELDVNTTLVCHISASKIRSSNIAKYIAAAFGVVDMGLGADKLLGKIKCELTARYNEKYKFVILIDDAQALTIHSYEILADLCALNLHGDALVQCFLFGEGLLLQQLHRMESARILTANNIFQLDIMGQTETRQYIEHRLLQAGWRGDPVISAKAFLLIHKIAKGVPWHINLLCHRLLLQACLEETHEIDEDLVSLFLTNEQLENNEQIKTREIHHAVSNGISNIVNLDNVTGSRAKFTLMTESDKPNKTEITSKTTKDTDIGLEAFTATNSIDSESAYEEDLSLSVYDVQSAYNDAIYSELHEPVQASFEIEKSNKEELDTNTSNAGTDGKLKERVKTRDHLLDKILPDSTTVIERAMQQLYSHSVQDNTGVSYKQYPLLSLPDQIRCARQYVEDIKVGHSELETRLSPMQIATTASIITSLVITLIILVVGEMRSANMVHASISKSNLTTSQPRMTQKFINLMTTESIEKLNPLNRIE